MGKSSTVRLPNSGIQILNMGIWVLANIFECFVETYFCKFKFILMNIFFFLLLHNIFQEKYLNIKMDK